MSSKGPRHDKIITNYDNASFSRQLTVVIPSRKVKICGMNTNATTTKCRMTEAPNFFLIVYNMKRQISEVRSSI